MVPDLDKTWDAQNYVLMPLLTTDRYDFFFDFFSPLAEYVPNLVDFCFPCLTMDTIF